MFTNVETVVPLAKELFLYSFKLTSFCTWMLVQRKRICGKVTQQNLNWGVARNRDWVAVTASLCILAHVAQSCCTQAARIQWISFFLRKTLFDFIKSCGGRIDLNFSGVALLGLLYSPKWKRSFFS